MHGADRRVDRRVARVVFQGDKVVFPEGPVASQAALEGLADRVASVGRCR